MRIDTDFRFDLTSGEFKCIRCEEIIFEAFVLNKFLNGEKLEPSKEPTYCKDCYLDYLVTGE